ncbi:hypothetical protein B0H11DRAFT_576562 [Mycena galericulata]|nr:hypothetical protein B0H11DRAFT_576562 [Mycena galericulata]
MRSVTSAQELSLHLVDPLPIGSSLVAVFDSCSSASLLDLAHFRCNRVYVPWIYKTRRRRDEIWDAVVRRNALLHPLRPLTPPTTDKVPIKNIFKALSFNSPHSLGEDQQAEEGRSPGSWLDTKAEAPSRESPEPIERWLCTGWCRPAEPEHETAEVISLAWCNDYQQSWQDAHRVSMTRELVRILEHDPHPKLQTLGMGLSHALHRMLKLAMEKSTEVYTDSYQSPELASPQPLDMARPWTM